MFAHSINVLAYGHIQRVLFFDEEQLHHGDEPYTYTNLTCFFFNRIGVIFEECALGEYALAHKKHSMIIHRQKSENKTQRSMCIRRFFFAEGPPCFVMPNASLTKFVLVPVLQFAVHRIRGATEKPGNEWIRQLPIPKEVEKKLRDLIEHFPSGLLISELCRQYEVACAYFCN